MSDQDAAATIRRFSMVEIGGQTMTTAQFDAARAPLRPHLPPEPVWQQGDVVRDYRGMVYLRAGHPDLAWLDVFGEASKPPCARTHLTLLVRDGKAV